MGVEIMIVGDLFRPPSDAIAYSLRDTTVSVLGRQDNVTLASDRALDEHGVQQPAG